MTADDIVKRARMRALVLGFEDLRSAIAEGLGKTRDDPEVEQLYRALLGGLAKRVAVAKISKVLRVSVGYWFDPNEAKASPTELLKLAMTGAKTPKGA